MQNLKKVLSVNLTILIVAVILLPGSSYALRVPMEGGLNRLESMLRGDSSLSGNVLLNEALNAIELRQAVSSKLGAKDMGSYLMFLNKTWEKMTKEPKLFDLFIDEAIARNIDPIALRNDLLVNKSRDALDSMLKDFLSNFNPDKIILKRETDQRKFAGRKFGYDDYVRRAEWLYEHTLFLKRSEFVAGILGQEDKKQDMAERIEIVEQNINELTQIYMIPNIAKLGFASDRPRQFCASAAAKLKDVIKFHVSRKDLSEEEMPFEVASIVFSKMEQLTKDTKYTGISFFIEQENDILWLWHDSNPEATYLKINLTGKSAGEFSYGENDSQEFKQVIKRSPYVRMSEYRSRKIITSTLGEDLADSLEVVNSYYFNDKVRFFCRMEKILPNGKKVNETKKRKDINIMVEDALTNKEILAFESAMVNDYKYSGKSSPWRAMEKALPGSEIIYRFMHNRIKDKAQDIITDLFKLSALAEQEAKKELLNSVCAKEREFITYIEKDLLNEMDDRTPPQEIKDVVGFLRNAIAFALTASATAGNDYDFFKDYLDISGLEEKATLEKEADTLMTIMSFLERKMKGRPVERDEKGAFIAIEIPLKSASDVFTLHHIDSLYHLSRNL